MSLRSSWTINGTRFAETRTERGGLRFFIDGTPTTKNEWHAAMHAAHARDVKQARTAESDNKPADGEVP